MEVALCLGASMACGITPFARESGHMLKSFVRGGVGARNGVSAALMAKAGYDAPSDIFDGTQGFFHSRTGSEDLGPEFLAGLATDYAIQDVVFKRASAGGPNQAPRQGLVELMTEHNVSPDDIAEIQVEVPPAGFDIITLVHHPSIEGKDELALAAIYGGTGFLGAHNEKYNQSPATLAIRERISISPRDEWAEEDRFRAMVTVRTKDGRELRRESIYRRMTEEDLDAKFADLVGMRAGEAKARELAVTLKGMDTVSNVAEIVRQLELPAAKIEDF